MANAASSVRINEHTLNVLSELSLKLGQPKAQVIEIALKALEEQIFWEEVAESYARIAADPEESARQQREIALWEQGTARDFVGEEW
jgi:predicted DNA-binding protein